MAPDDFTLIIGAMKSGTTTLFHDLARHPQIAACSDKEPAFFSREHIHENGYAWYQDLWPDHDPKVHRTALEATSAYTKRPRFDGVPERIRRVADEHDARFRFLYILRDPLDRITSHMTHAIAGGDPSAHHLDGIRKGSIEGHTLEVSMYARQLDAYLEHFDRDRFHLIPFEAFVEDPAPVLEGIADFLDLDPFPETERPEALNQSVGKYETGRLWTLIEETGLVRLADPLPDRVKQPFRDLLGERIEEKIEPSPELAGFLLSALSHDMERMRTEHGFDTSHWTTLEDLDKA